jgi:anti-anti-sigma factor
MTVSTCNRSVLLHVQGRLDFQGCQVLQQRLAEIESSRFKFWILDLSCVDFMGSIGVESLVKAVKFAAKQDCRLAICDPHPAVQLVFELTRLDQVVECLDMQNLDMLEPSTATLPLRAMRQAVAA